MEILSILKILFLVIVLHTPTHGGVQASRLIERSPAEPQFGREPLHGEKFADGRPHIESGNGGATKTASMTARHVQGVLEDRLATPIGLQRVAERLLTTQMGSKPPNCDGKCDLCGPCVAVEVPISNHAVQQDNGNLAPQQQQAGNVAIAPDDTNYMPESWRCSCGDIYYNP